MADTHLLVGLVDRDVLAGHSRVPDEKRGRRQSAKSSTNDVRPHRLSPPNSAAALETDHPHQLPPASAAPVPRAATPLSRGAA